MRAAVIFGPGASSRDLKPFQQQSNCDWLTDMPASASEADAVLIFGGDGTVHRHLPQLVNLQLPLLVVPAGSGNDFARALDLRRISQSLAAWKGFSCGSGTTRRIDLGAIRPLLPDLRNTALHNSNSPASRDTHYFCCVAGCGLDSEVARLANRFPRWLRARGGYALALPAALAAFAPPRIKLSLPQPGNAGRFVPHSEQRATLVAFANAPAYGHGMRIAPCAALDDAKLDICVVGLMGKLRLLRLFPTVYSGQHLSFPEVQYFQQDRLRLETDHPLDLYADGEYVCQTPVEITVAPAALQVITFPVLH